MLKFANFTNYVVKKTVVCTVLLDVPSVARLTVISLTQTAATGAA